MPLYEFRCRKCSGRFEELCESVESADRVRCPECGSQGVERLLSTFATSVKGGRTRGSSSACSSCSATSCATCRVR